MPAVSLLKKANPTARISWLINPQWAPLLQENPYVDEVLLFPRHEFRNPKKWPAIFQWANSLRRMKIDLALDFQGLLRSALVAQLCPNAKIYGLSDAREGARFFYNHTVKVDRHQHSVERYLKLASEFSGHINQPLEFPLPLGKKPIDFSVSSPFLLFHPFSRGIGKSLLASDIEFLCKEFFPIKVVLVGKYEGKFSGSNHCINLLNRTTLAELIWLIRHAHFTISVDSGPMHIAAAITDQLLSIHTWSNPKLVGPFNSNAWILKDKRLLQMKYQSEMSSGTPCSLADIVIFIKSKFPIST